MIQKTMIILLVYFCSINIGCMNSNNEMLNSVISFAHSNNLSGFLITEDKKKKLSFKEITDSILILEKQGINIDCIDKNENNAAHLLLLFSSDPQFALRGYVTDDEIVYSQMAEESVLLLKWLLTHGIDINERNNQGWTLLHYAIHKNFIHIADYLIKNGADVNAKLNDYALFPDYDTSYGGFTPLMLTIDGSVWNYPLFCILLENGSDPNFLFPLSRHPGDYEDSLVPGLKYIQQSYNQDKKSFIETLLEAMK